MSDTVKTLVIIGVSAWLGPQAGTWLTGGATSGFTFAATSAAVTAGTAMALSKALGVGPDPYQQQLAQRNQMVRQPLVTRDTVYGLTKKSGNVLFMESTGNNQTLHLVLQLASHQIESIDKVYFNDEALTIASAGTDSNGETQFKVTSPAKYSSDSKFTRSTKSFIVSEYVDVVVNVSMPFGGSRQENGKGIKKGTTSITLISDTAFTMTAGAKINLGGRDYTISSGGSSSGSGTRHTRVITISEGLVRDLKASSILTYLTTPRAIDAHGFHTIRIQPYRNNPNTPLPFLAGTSTGVNFAIVASQIILDTSSFTVLIKKHLGADNQVADVDLINSIPAWTNDHTLSGISYLYVQLKYDADTFPRGIPTVSAEIKGKKVLDFRNGNTVFSANPALCLYDYLSDTRFGLATPTTNIDTASFTTLANICDENIALAAGGTEKRYEANGILYSNIQPMINIDELLGAMVGILSYSNGKFFLAGGKYVAPSITFDESDFVTGFTLQTKTSRRNLFNTVKGVFTSPENDWQPSDYPMVTSSTFVSEDSNETIFGEIDLPFTTSSTMAQRIAKIALFKNRQQMILSTSMNLSAFNIQVGDTININNSRMGFSNKIFQVADWTFAVSTSGINIDLSLQETSSAVYDWDAEETSFINDNTNLPTANTVSAPSLVVGDIMRPFSGSAITVLLITVKSTQGTTSQFEVEYRNTATDIEFTSLGRSTGNNYEVQNVQDGEIYEVRAKSINAFNVSSPYTSIDYDVIGKTEVPANVGDFSINVVGNLVVCSWSVNNELDLSHYIIRHTPATSSPVYAGATIVADYISKATNQISLPAQTGTYMIKAIDVLGLASETSTKSTIIRNQIADDFNAVVTTTQSTGFSGIKTDAEVVSRGGVNFLQIILGELFDDHSGNFDSAVGSFDDGGEVGPNLDAFYDFSTNPIDLGAIYNSQVTTSMTSIRFNANTLFDSFEGLFDIQEGNFDGSSTEQDDVNASIQISTSNDNSTYTPYSDYILGNYKARYIKIRVKLTTTNGDSTPAISALSATIDMPDRTVAVDDTASGTASGGKAITFSPAFKELQGLGISVSNMTTGDFYEITNKSATGFTIKFKNSSGTIINRTFDFVAKGFGYLESS